MSRQAGVVRGYPGVSCENAVAVGEPRISQGVTGVQLDGILKAPNGQTHRSRQSLMPVVTSLEVQFVRCRVLRRSLYAATQAHLESLCDRPGNLILQVKDIVHPTVVTLRP